MRLLSADTNHITDTLNALELFIPNFLVSIVQTGTFNAHELSDNIVNLYSLFLHPQVGFLNYTNTPLTIDASTAAWQCAHIMSQQPSLTWATVTAPSIAAQTTVALQIGYNICWTLAELGSVVYITSMLWIGISGTNNGMVTTITRSITGLRQLIYSWILFSQDKVETTEESVILLILWPWCLLLIVTHMMTAADHTMMFGFAEWGLPITYGLIMLLEHCWAMGLYFLIYLTGAAGKRSNIGSALEDIVALAILVARVCLQAVRGIVVGMFHFISRELIWNMSTYWNHNDLINHATETQNSALNTTLPIGRLTIDILLTSSSFVIITAVMFLQLLFLLVSVWLFCKCWFISWRKC